MTIVSEEIAQATAMQLRKRPIEVYALPPDMQKRLPEFEHREDDPPFQQ